MRAVIIIPLLLTLEVFGMHPAYSQAAPAPAVMRPSAGPAVSPTKPSSDSMSPARSPFDMLPAQPKPPATTENTGIPELPAATNPFDMSPPGARTRGPAPTSVRGLPANDGVTAGRYVKPLLPFAEIRFEGESDARSWAFNLTQEEASAAAGLAVGYQNAIVVMPEASRLRISINGEAINDITIASAAAIFRSILPIRPGLLHPGQNVIRMEAVQRHRTDCTIRATYELWTQLDASSTGLIFSDNASKVIRSLDDLPAVGLDTQGITTIRIVAPGISRPAMRDRLLRLSQMVALRGRYAHPVIRISESDPGPATAGTIKVVMGIWSELQSVMGTPPEAAHSQPLAVILHDGNLGSATLVVSGPTWSDLDNAINIVGAPSLDRDEFARVKVDTASWMWPNTPTLPGGTSTTFSELGIPTQEFSGRRLRARFAVNLPADFYASDYGEATLLLDAAHTPAVLPGSRIDVYVNSRISATMTITSRGEVFRRHPIRIPMRNFRSGINHVSFEVILLTAADERCAPGETLSVVNRFALFDTTSLYIPTYGQIGRVPDLAAISSGGFPVGAEPAAVVLTRLDAMNYSASGTLLARMARDSGEAIQVQYLSADLGGDVSTVIIGPVDQLAVGTLERVNVSKDLKAVWQPTTAPSPLPAGATVARQTTPATSSEVTPANGDDAPGVQASTTESISNEEIRRRWAENLQRRSFIQRSFEPLKVWMEGTFNLSLASLALADHSALPYEPPQHTSLLLTQSVADGDGTRTLITARTSEALADEMVRLTNPITWSQLSGRAAALDTTENKFEIEPVIHSKFVQTRAFSLLNLRLVAANWWSTNILQYALLIVACCVLLGGATYLMLNHLGRKK